MAGTRPGRWKVDAGTVQGYAAVQDALEDAVKAAGSYTSAAKLYGVGAASIWAACTRGAPIGPKLWAALGFERVVIYRRVS